MVAHCSDEGRSYTTLVPRLWSNTIEAHRRGVREAVMHTAAALVAHRGLHAVTMSQIAEEAGIGRATLYKYFPDVESILVAWHGERVAEHLTELEAIRDRAGSAGERLAAVLDAYARILTTRGRGHGPELAGLLHRDEHIAEARRRLHVFVADLVADAARAGEVRDDVAADELAAYCLHAIAAARTLPDEEAVRRLVNVTLTGLRSR
jgi:AcrR family transcriptional regulator